MRFVVVGDLHLDSRERRVFAQARDELSALQPEAVVCLGDLGVGAHSGTKQSFVDARDYLAGFGARYQALLGNHDLERLDEFASDPDVVRAFCDVFRFEKPYRTFALGPALGLVLSSTGFRGNRGYRHEISIDEEQWRWFEQTLNDNRERTIIVFSHAPPLGSQLRVLQYPHLRAGNAWLNHSNRPQRFVDLLKDHPQVRAWFSGHNHLGQHYPDSLSHVGNCLFVHTGVIGAASRDSDHHSRVVTLPPDCDSIEIATFDHTTHTRSRDATFHLQDNRVEHEAPASAPGLSPERFFSPPSFEQACEQPDAIAHGASLFCVHRNMLLEYDVERRDPVGVVEDWLGRSRPAVEDGEFVLRSWLGGTAIEAGHDGYRFKLPSQRRRLLQDIREAIARRTGRSLW